MSDVRDLRGRGPLVVVVAVATTLVVLVCVVAAAAMLLGAPAAPRASADDAPPVPHAPATTAVSRDESAGRPAPDGEGDLSGADLELASAAVAGALGSSTCTDVAEDAAALAATTTALGDPATWIRRGILDGAVGRPLESFAEACGSVHASSVVATLGLPGDVAGPLAAYVANGGARSSVDAVAARDRLAVGVPADLLVGETATRQVREFMLPSGNIACTLGAGGARCEIADADFGTDPAGACEGRWGGLLTVGADVGAPGCLEAWSGLGAGTVLRYGESTRVEGFSCASGVEGVACRNDATGHGFWLRSSEFRVF